MFKSWCNPPCLSFLVIFLAACGQKHSGTGSAEEALEVVGGGEVPDLIDESPTELWENDKFTRAQPWPGRVIAVYASWMGYTLLVTDLESESRLCLVTINVMGSIIYRELMGETLKRRARAASAIALSPGIEVGRFSWSVGPYSLGKRFGEADLLRQTAELVE